MSDDNDTTDLKEAFALHSLLSHGDAQEAARIVAPTNRQFQAFIAANWPRDEYVMMARKRLLTEHGAAFFLPDKYDVAHMTAEVIKRAITADDKLKAIKLYAELMGMIDKGSAVTVNNTVQHNKVMIVRDHGTDDAWEAKLKASQRKLIESADVTRH